MSKLHHALEELVFSVMLITKTKTKKTQITYHHHQA